MSESAVYLGAIDNGTTSSRFLIFDKAGIPVASHQIEFKQYYPHSGWHEHDPLELISSVEECIAEATKKFEELGHSKADIKAVGITNQRETTVVWDSETGEPLHNAIVWTDTRSAAIARELKERKGADELMDICGEPLSTYPSSAKLTWLLRNDSKVKKAYEAGKLAFGTVDAWLVYNLNGKEKNVFVTDVTNASRTMFMNIHTLEYDDKLLDFFQLDKTKCHFPKIVASSDAEVYGTLGSGPLKGTKITGCLGDQSAALVGQKGFEPGTAKNTYGTGCFLLYNTGEKPVISKHGLLTTVAFSFKGMKPVYALEGSIAVGGSSVKFLMNNLGFFRDSAKVSEVAETVKDNGGVVFVTAFSGLFAPYWIDDAKGTLFGITQHTQRGHIARATLEATCFQTRAILSAMSLDSSPEANLTSLSVDGGMSNSDLTMQTQSNLIQIPVHRPQMRETTALGAAIAAGFGVAVYSDFGDLQNVNTEGKTVFTPQIKKDKADYMFERWSRAVDMSRGWTVGEKVDEDEDPEKDATNV